MGTYRGAVYLPSAIPNNCRIRPGHPIEEVAPKSKILMLDIGSCLVGHPGGTLTSLEQDICPHKK